MSMNRQSFVDDAYTLYYLLLFNPILLGFTGQMGNPPHSMTNDGKSMVLSR